MSTIRFFWSLKLARIFPIEQFGRGMLLLLLLATPWAFAQSPVAASLEAQRSAFKAAQRAVERGHPIPASSFLRDYPLYPYLRYHDLRRRLHQHPAAEVADFLARYDDSPLAPQLYQAWLKQLAQDGQWRRFLRHFDKSTQDAALRCWQRQAFLHTGQRAKALADVENLWMQGSSQPTACDPLFALWQRQGGFTPERIWKRFELAMVEGQRGLGRYLKGLMTDKDRAAAELWMAVDENPRLILQPNRFDRNDPRLIPILIHGLQRWSQADSVAAAAALDRLKRRYPLPQAELTAIERRLAVLVTSRGHPDGLRRLTALPTAAVDTQAREWGVRAHLKRGDWKGALAWLERLTAEEKATPRWQYWRARALAATGHDKQARRLYQELAKQRDYHGFLAADHLNLPYQLNADPLQVSARELEAIARTPAIQRARELYHFNRQGESRAEWQYALDRLDEREIKAAAMLAHQWGWHHQVITTLARVGHWDAVALRFPTPYRDQVLASARQQGVDPAWVFAVMRQESAFQPDARSPAGALGLMQIMPATGRRIARDLQFPLPNRYGLLDTDTNIRFGAYYLRYTSKKFQNNALLATAAYNAGPNRVQRWLPREAPVAADIWAETIPYSETRKYVQRVMEYAIIYEHHLGITGEVSNTLLTRMGAVLPPAGQLSQR